MNGININVTENDFKSKPPEERDWMLFQAIICMNKEGCDWGQERYKNNNLGKVYIWGAGFGGVVGIVALIWKIFF